MTAKPVRIGVVGCGNVAAQYVAQAERLLGKGRAELVLACGRETQRTFAREELGIPNFCTDFRQLVSSPDVDLVLVLTSPKDHGAIARAALEAGKHVLVEKPFATSLEEAAALVALARKSPGFLLCAPSTILSPTFRILRRRIAKGDVGKVVSARGRYGWAGPGWSRWFYQPGGGPMVDLAVYNVTTLTGLLGPARRVIAMTGTAIPERTIRGERLKVEVEDNAHLLIDFGDAAYAVVTTGFTIQQYRGPALEIYGTRGTIQMLGDDWDPEGYELWQNEVGAWQAFKESAPDWPWTDGLNHLVDCIANRVPPAVTPEHAYHVLEIITQARASARDGEAKPVRSVFTPPPIEGTHEAEPAHLVHDRSRNS